jgi:dipeptidyl aminopeptidase/acylaminoacyl peptidase
MIRLKAALLCLLASAAPALAAPDGLPMAPARTVSLDVDRGTWMSLDLAPDGASLVFDLLGDLYRLPAGGGQAQALSHGLGFDAQPVVSPDGRWIAFVSDRSGSDYLWVMRADGSDARQITFFDDETAFVSPAWRADGKAIFVSRYYASLTHYELIEQPLDGLTVTLIPVRPDKATPRAQWQSSLGASPSRDGRFLYFARLVGETSLDEPKCWSIVRRVLADGSVAVVIGGLSGRGAPKDSFFRPRIAPDGVHLAYAARRGGKTELRLRDLSDGSDRRLGFLDPDQLQSAHWQDIVPGFAWTADGNGLVLSRGGRIERLDVASGTAIAVPFRAAIAAEVGPSTRGHVREERGPVQPRLIMAPIAAPDDKAFAFSALGAIWIQDMAGRRPARRLSPPGQAAFQPSWSPDGRTIVYTSWDEREGGWLWTMPASGSAAPAKLSPVDAFYTYPVFTPDGGSVLAIRSPAAARQQTGFEFGKLRQAELVEIPLGGGRTRKLTEGRIGGRPHFTRASGLVHILTGDGLAAVDLATGARRKIVQVKGPGYYFQDGQAAVDDMRIAPDGRSLLVQIAQQLHLVALPESDGGEIDLEKPGDHRRITDVGADYFEWRPDGGIEYSVGSRFVRLRAALTGPIAPARETRVRVAVPRAAAPGDLLLRGARLMTMAGGDRVIDDADLLVSGGRIKALGPRGSLAVPPTARVIDMAGKTILPGFVDEHDHIGSIRREVLSLDDWSLRARLAWGVTTSFDPSTLSIDMMAYQDLLDAGLMVGPRLRMTGPALFSFNRFTSLDQVRAVLRRYRDDYRLGNIKEYRTGNRRVRQWVAMAARELGLQPTTEGALSMKLDLTQIIDGYAGNEHVLPASPLGPDVIGLLAAMRTSYSTTLMTTNSGPPGAEYFVAKYDPALDPKVRRFWPMPAIEQKLTGQPFTSLIEERFPIAAAGAASLARAGGLVGIGGHGEIPGPGFHWELEAHVMGGMTPIEALHAATAGSAETIGRLDDLGTLEPGKAADLVILDADPRVDIRNTQKIAAVMQSGRLYDGATLDEIWPGQLPLPDPAGEPHATEPWLPAPAQKP